MYFSFKSLYFDVTDNSNMNMFIKTEEKFQSQQLNQAIRTTISEIGPGSHLCM